MNLILACLAWTFIAFVLGLGLYLLIAKGTLWLFALAFIGFLVAVGKIGCATH